MKAFGHRRPFMDAPCRSLPARFITLLLTTAAFVFLAAGPARACEVVVVKGADLKPYRDALRGFEDATSCEVRVVNPGNGDPLEDIQPEPGGIVVAIGTTAFRKVKALKDRTIVYVMVISSETDRAPSPNISGVGMDIAPGVSLASMQDIFPGVKRVGLVYDPRHTLPFVEEAARTARSTGIELTAKQVHDASGIPAALDGLHDKIDLLWMTPDPTVVADETVDYLLRFSIQHNIPIFTFSKKYVEMGAVASLDMDPYDMGAQAAEIVKRIAAGGADTIRVYARAARLSINEKAARKMGLKIRDEILKKAGKNE